MKRDNPDGNAKEILANLRLDGWSCCRIAKAYASETGVPDAIVARPGKRRNHLVEIKRLGGVLRPSQAEFARAWPGCLHIVTNSRDANLLLRECEERP